MSISITVPMIHLVLSSPIVPVHANNLIANPERLTTVSMALFLSYPEGYLLESIEALVGHRQVAFQSILNM
jgi:hypothetical protein